MQYNSKTTVNMENAHLASRLPITYFKLKFTHAYRNKNNQNTQEITNYNNELHN